MGFRYFFFKPISVEAYGVVLTGMGRQITARSRDDYSMWLVEYYRKSQLFYQCQYRIHRDEVWSSFCRNFGVMEYESPDDYGLTYEWAEWQHQADLNGHRDQYEAVEVTIAHALEAHKMDQFSGLLDQLTPSTLHELDSVWFNSTIGNPQPTVDYLNSLSYERYLLTDHWRKIRAAMILINNATCQARECRTVGESWYGGNWEADLNVHHSSYSNRGNERFEDLVLLCTRHHETLHANLRAYNEPRFEVL